MKIQIIVVSLLAVALARPLYAQGMMGCGGGMLKGMKHGSSHEEQGHATKNSRGGTCPMMSGKSTLGFYLDNKKQLNLSDEQVEKLESLQSDLEQPLPEISATLHKAYQEVEALVEQPDATRAELREKLQALEKYFTAIKLANLEARREARNILTPEQWEKTQALRNQAGDGHSGDMGGCGMMGKAQDGAKPEEHQMHHN